MNNLKKKIVAMIIGLSMVAMMAPGLAQALTAAEIQTQIDTLMASLAILQGQLTALEGAAPAAGVTGCTITSFARNLKQGMTGDDVKCLQIVLNSASATQVAATGVGSSGNETTYFGALTKAAVVKYQEKNAADCLTPLGLTTGTGFVGVKTLAKLNAVLTAEVPAAETPAAETPAEETPAAEVPATGLTVALASDTPAATTMVAGSAYNVFTKVKLTAGTAGDATITGITVTRTGYSNDNDVSGVLIQDSSGVRHGNVLTFSENKANISFASAPITIAAGKTDYLTIEAHLDAVNAASGTIALGIAAASDITTTAEVSGAPVTGNLMGMTAGAGIIGAITVDESLISAATRNIDLGVTDQQVGKFRIASSNANEDIYLKGLTLYNNGTSADGDIANIDLVAPDGTVLSTVSGTTGKYVTFDFSASPYKISKGTNKIFTVRADVISGSNRTTQFVIQNDYDVVAYGGSTGVGLLATAAGTVDAAGFPVGDNTATDNSILAAAGTLTVSKDSSSPSGEVGVGATEVTMGVWKLQASGEDMQLMKIDVDMAASTETTLAADAAGTLKVKIAGSTIWSQDATTGGALNILWNNAANQATLSSYVTIPANTSKLLSVVMDVSTAATNGRTFIANIASLYYKKLSTNTYATANAAWTPANPLTVSAATLTVTKNTAVPSMSKIKGATNLLVGSYSLQAGAAEIVNVNTINVDVNVGGVTTGLTNLTLKDSAGSQLGSILATPSALTGANSFSVSGQLNISASGTKVIYAYVDTATTAGNITTTIPASGINATGASSGNTIAAPTVAVTGQTVAMTTVGTLTVALNSSTTPSAAVLHASETEVSLADIKFTGGVQEDITLNKVELVVMNGEANYSTISLWDGTTQVGEVAGTNLVNGIASFTGLSKLVAKDSSVTLRVKASTNISGALKSQLKTKVGVRYVEATGKDSGTILKPGVSSIDGALATGVSGSYELGEVVVFAKGSANEETALAINTVAGTGITAAFDYSTTVDRAANTIAATTDSLVRFPYISTEALTGATGQYSYAIGDVVLYRDASTAGTYVGHIAAATPTVTYYDDAGNAPVTTVFVNTDKVAKLYSGGIMETLTAASVSNTYAAGQAVYYYDATNGASNLAVCSTLGTGATARFALASKGQTVVTPAVADVIIAVPYIWTESLTVGTATSNAYTIGDVVLYYDLGTTHTHLAVVTAVPTATTPTFTADGDNVVFNAAAYATGDLVTKLYSVGAVGKRMTIHDGEPVVTSAATITSSQGSAQKVAEFSIQAQGREVNVTSVDLTKTGSNRPYQYVRSFDLYQGTTKLASATTPAFASTADAGVWTITAVTTTIKLCNTNTDAGANGEINYVGLGDAIMANIKKGDKVVFYEDATNYFEYTVTNIAQAAACTGSVDADDVTLTVTSGVGAGVVDDDVPTLYNYNVHFDANSTVPLAQQDISKDTTLVLTVKANTNDVRSGLAAGVTATFGLTLNGTASQDPAATESYGLTWGYTTAGAVTAALLQICDSYPLYGPTFSY